MASEAFSTRHLSVTPSASAAMADRGQFAVGGTTPQISFAPVPPSAEVLAEPPQQGRTQQLWLVTITSEQRKELACGQLRLQNLAHSQPDA
jgi:hypothetical protein